MARKQARTARNARRAETPADLEVARALVDVALIYRAQHHRLQRLRRGRGLDRGWSHLADRARLTRSLLFALLDDLAGQPRAA